MSRLPAFGFNSLRVALLTLAGLAGPVRGEELDSVMYSQPEIRVARVANKYPDGLADLWLAALERPERETRARAALAIAQAHEEGMPGLAAMAPPLLKVLDKPGEHPAVLAAAARALVALDARGAAPAFLNLAKSGDPDLRDLVEPVLARWGHKPAYEMWLARVGQSPPHRYDFLLALRCLGVVREDRAAPRLRDLALSPDATPAVRLAAARALAEVRTSGSEADAAKLGGDRTAAGRTSRLVAASLLRHHQGDETTRLLKALAADADPAVALAALTRLSELGTQHVLPILRAVITSEGAEVRVHGVAAMVRHPSDEYVRRLAGLLHDPHPDVRVTVRKGLRELAAARRALVIDLASGALNDRDWRGQEQAAILLAQLDHKPAAGRMVALLTTNRPEVAVAVGWGLRKLAVRETLPAALAHVKARHAALLAPPRRGVPPGLTADTLDRQLSHLVQFMGQAGYREADAELRAIVPRILRGGFPPDITPVGPEVRTAAIWSLGRLHEGAPDGALVGLVEGRLTGDGMLGRDHPHVRTMAAVTLGVLGAKQSLPVLRATGPLPTTDPVPNACRWAVERLTKEPAPPPGVVESTRRQWFLAPLR